jgi:hypothetical protein
MMIRPIPAAGALFTSLIAALFAVSPAPTLANTLYRCADDSGVVLYTNQKPARSQCTVLSVRVPPPPAAASASSAGAAAAAPRRSGAAATPSPADFPRVSANEQGARDRDRRAILEAELQSERSNLETARRQLDEAGRLSGAATPAPLRDRVALHERNIEALTKEMSKLR